MNLFELFIKIGVDDQASKNISKITQGLGNGLKTAAKIGAAAVGAAASGVTALTTAAVKNYAEYEQLVGGAELMFGKAYDTVAKNAQDAYKTVQMSQNEYLQQVNGFATGLKTALSGNEQAAADLAHRIVKAEADIIAATGNTAENVQNAFNGIMKSNYTMLDNLQIGITPTKEGFQEVIDKVNDWNKANGEATKYQMGNLADMQSALVDYIDMVGMSGYAQREASETITGSLSSMKAAWKNLVTGFANDAADLDKLIGNLTDSIVGYTDESGKHVKGVLDNLLPAVEKSLGGIAKLIEGAAPKIIDILPGLVERVVPSVISAATDMVNAVVGVLPDLLSTVVDAIMENAPALIDSAIVLIGELSNGILDQLPQIVQLGLDLVVSLANGISGSLPELIPTIVGVVSQIVETLINNADLLINAALEIIVALAMGLIASIPQLIEAIPKIVIAIVNAFESLMSQITEIGKNIVNAIGNGIKSLVSKAVTWARDLINNFISGIKSLISQIIGVGKSVVTAVGDGIKSLASEALTWGKDMIDNFVNGIKSKINAVTSVVSNIANTIKSFLGFSEPEKGPLSNFHTFAPDMMNLFIKGIRDNEKKLTDQIEKTFDFGERTITAGISYGSYGNNGFSAGSGHGASQVSVVQNIYSEAKTAADLMQEALYQQKKAVLLGV